MQLSPIDSSVTSATQQAEIDKLEARLALLQAAVERTAAAIAVRHRGGRGDRAQRFDSGALTQTKHGQQLSAPCGRARAPRL